jgi:catalase
MMEGFGVHTFRFVNAEGQSSFVKFHWKPLLGIHSVVWDEAQRISGCDPDFHRRDLWEAIENGDFPEWELGVQIVPESDEHKFGFDLLDPTKLIPEELVPVQRIGKMTLNRNPDNFFAEVEQSAFHIGHVVPGIDFTNDPLLQGRLFSYTDTQLIRLGGPNFHEIPINRAIAPMHNNQRDGHMRQEINRGRTAYSPNSLAANQPAQVPSKDGGFKSFAERISATKIRARSASFADHFSQAAMFFHSQSPVEQAHIVGALRFELGKVEASHVRERMLYVLSQIDGGLASKVATGLGMPVPDRIEMPLNQNVSADGDSNQQPKKFTGKPVLSPALSMAKTISSAKTRKIAALAGDGCDDKAIAAMKKTLKDAGAMLKVVGLHGGSLKGASGADVPVDYALLTTASVLFDGLFIPGGDGSIVALLQEMKALEFTLETFKHCKPICAAGAASKVLDAISVPKGGSDENAPALPEGIVLGDDARKIATQFVAAIAGPRAWSREKPVGEARAAKKPAHAVQK